VSSGDYGIFAGLVIALWAGGYCTGLMFRTVRQVLERVTGAGSL